LVSTALLWLPAETRVRLRPLYIFSNIVIACNACYQTFDCVLNISIRPYYFHCCFHYERRVNW
jgi:hypothetical protein